MFPTIVPALISELLLSPSVRGHTAEEADESSMGTEDRAMLPCPGLSEKLCGHLEVVQQVAIGEFGLLAK